MAGTHSVKIGIIGGSGLGAPDILKDRVEKEVETPFGKPSDVLVTGTIQGVPCVLLARHGRKHTVMPSNVNYRANLWALREEGCSHVVVTTACGSLQEEVHPGDCVILDQFIDRTTKRISTFYDGQPGSPKGVCHIPMDTPFCERTREIIIQAATVLGSFNSVHRRGTVLTIEGPRFSSQAESNLWRQFGAHVVNMTTVPEVCLARELALCYAAIALPTDYDSWHQSQESVSVELVMKTFKENASKATDLLLAVIPRIAAEDWSDTLAELQMAAKAAVLQQ